MSSTSQTYLANQHIADDRRAAHQDEERWPIPQAVLFIIGSAAACWLVLITFVMWLFG